MLNVRSGYSQSPSAAVAAAEIASQILQQELKLIIFFASNIYDFTVLSKEMKKRFSGVELIGCTTAGELSNKGFTERSVVALGIAADNFTPVSTVVKDIHSTPMLYRKKVESAFKEAGFDPADPACSQKGFGIVLIDGLQGAEEKVLSVVNSVIKAPDFQIIGGSAGDGLEFKNTYVCLNGDVYSDAAVVTFIKTNKKFYIHKEDIFCTTEKSMTVTKANIRERLVQQLDNKPAAQAYAEYLGIPKHELAKYFTCNPLGRRIGSKIWTASPFQVMSDDSIKFYSQIFQGTLVDILCPEDVIKKAEDTVKAVKEKIPGVKAVIAVNCILRTLQFKEQNHCGRISAELSQLGQVVGFSSYGEQLCKMHLNQTLVLLALGE
jgi:hypothetical protein